MMTTHQIVIPAKAGISGQDVTTRLHETPAFAGETRGRTDLLHEAPACAGATIARARAAAAAS